MSDERISKCPKCRGKTEEMLSLERAMSEKYGKVPIDDYRAMEAKLKKLADKAWEETLRHYYEIGVDSGGRFDVSYSCICDCCGWKFRFDYGQQVYPEKNDGPPVV